MSLVQQSGLVNSQNSHFSNPGFSSRVGAASGCGGSVTSADALNQTGMYEVMKIGGAKKCPKSCKCTCHNCYCRGKCSGKCGCPCHKKCPGNCGCRCHKCMSCGKRHRKGGKKCAMSGGNGYGFSKSQTLAPTSGVNSGNSVHLAGFTGYQNNGIDSDTNMGASSQSGGSGYGFGSGGTPYYSFNPSEGENLSPFAGSGYPPISRQLNNQCITPPILVQEGGKTRKSRKGKKSRKGRKSRKASRRRRGAGNRVLARSNSNTSQGSMETISLGSAPVSRQTSLQGPFSRQSSNQTDGTFETVDLSTPPLSRESSLNSNIDVSVTEPIPKPRARAKTIGGKYRKKGRKSRRRQRGGSGQYMSNIANSHIYSTGAPPSLNPNESMLASPPPFTPKNDCLNTWKHLGDTPPYNTVYM
jgi:hypothetical protein